MLEQVTEAMVAIHEHYYHRKPASAHTRKMGDDMLACMFGGPYTNVEQTLIELQRRALVHESRSAFQQAMEARFMDEVERITRRVVKRFRPITSGPISNWNFLCSDLRHRARKSGTLTA